MPNNDQIILDSVLEQQRQQLAPELSQAEFFEVVILAFGKIKPRFDEISKLDPAVITDAKLSEATAFVVDQFSKLGGTDPIAKSSDFLSKVTTRLAAQVDAGAKAPPPDVAAGATED